MPRETSSVIPRRIGELLQSDTALLTRLRRAGFRLNAKVAVRRVNGTVRIGTGQHATELDRAAAAQVYITAD